MAVVTWKCLEHILNILSVKSVICSSLSINKKKNMHLDAFGWCDLSSGSRLSITNACAVDAGHWSHSQVTAGHDHLGGSENLWLVMIPCG